MPESEKVTLAYSGPAVNVPELERRVAAGDLVVVDAEVAARLILQPGWAPATSPGTAGPSRDELLQAAADLGVTGLPPRATKAQIQAAIAAATPSVTTADGNDDAGAPAQEG